MKYFTVRNVKLDAHASFMANYHRELGIGRIGPAGSSTCAVAGRRRSCTPAIFGGCSGGRLGYVNDVW